MVGPPGAAFPRVGGFVGFRFNVEVRVGYAVLVVTAGELDEGESSGGAGEMLGGPTFLEGVVEDVVGVESPCVQARYVVAV